VILSYLGVCGSNESVNAARYGSVIMDNDKGVVVALEHGQNVN
jgi:hypothetical protein